MKVASVVVAICRIFTLGLFFENSRLKLKEASARQNYRSAIPKIKSKPIRSEKPVNLAQMKHQAKTKTVSDDAFADVPKEKIDMQTKMVGEKIHESPKTVTVSMETKKQEPMMTRETAPSQRVALKAGQARVRAFQTKAKSDSSDAGEKTHDVQKTEDLLAGKEIEKPMLSRGHVQVKRIGKGRSITDCSLKEGDNLFRIIIRAYGTYNDKIDSLVHVKIPKFITQNRSLSVEQSSYPRLNNQLNPELS